LSGKGNFKKKGKRGGFKGGFKSTGNYYKGKIKPRRQKKGGFYRN